eukprot:11189143-Karenia_brevis.AAC.1
METQEVKKEQQSVAVQQQYTVLRITQGLKIVNMTPFQGRERKKCQLAIQLNNSHLCQQWR